MVILTWTFLYKYDKNYLDVIESILAKNSTLSIEVWGVATLIRAKSCLELQTGVLYTDKHFQDFMFFEKTENND